jgi:hypothetical protein
MKKKIMISHGNEHSLEESKDCSLCQEMLEEFNQAMQSGEIKKMFKNLPKSRKDVKI